MSVENPISLTGIEQIERDHGKSFAVGEMAARIDDVYQAERVQGKGVDFLHALINHVQINSLPHFLRENRGIHRGRRLPSFKESVIETSKRLAFLEEAIEVIPDSVSGILCGGSLSYGRFYVVREESDVDLFLIVAPSFYTSSDADQLFSPEKGFDPTEVEKLAVRLRQFPQLYEQQRVDMMSEKFATRGFVTSLKIIPEEYFKKEFIWMIEERVESTDDHIAVCRDFKPGPYPMQQFTQYNLSGQPTTYTILEEALDEDGTITSIPAFILSDGRFYTGDHHNHIIPLFEIMYDKTGSVQKTVDSFRSLLSRRLDVERMQGEHNLDIINVQDRRFFFSPQVTQKAYEVI